MASSKIVAGVIATVLACSDALRRQSSKGKASDERAALARGLDYQSAGLDAPRKAYLMGTKKSAATWRYGPNWKDSFNGAIRKLGRTGCEVDDHDGTPIGNGESIGLVAGKLSLDPAQVSKLPRAFQTGIFRDCGSRCPQMPASIRFSHTNAADLDLQRISLKLHTTKYGEVDFHFTETLKGFPIGNYDQLNAFSFSVRHGMAASVLRFPREWVGMASQTSTLKANGVAEESKKRGAMGKTYYSHLPFRLGSAGSSAGAFKVRLVAQQSPRHPGGSTKQAYLKNMRDQLVSNVEAGENKFSFEIQVATNPRDHDIMDAATIWNETSAPWVRMGTMSIQKQLFKKPVNVCNVVGSGLWVGGRAPFNSKELAFLPANDAHPPVGDVGHFRSYLYPLYDRERQEVLLGKPGGAPARCPLR